MKIGLISVCLFYFSVFYYRMPQEKKTMSAIKTSLLALLLLIIFTPVTHAYLDPNSGSYILQITAAAVFGGIFIAKTWWAQIKATVLNFVNRKDRTTSEKHSTKNK